MTYPASPAQTSFINDLLAKRQVTPAIRDAIANTTGMTSKQASAFIDLLKVCPYLPRTTAAKPARQAHADLYARIPDAKYALSTAGLAQAFPGLSVHGDLIFIEVRTYQGTRYLRTLHGAPGDFTRGRIARQHEAGLLALIDIDPLAASTRFAQEKGVCGKCAAPLTDETSRARMFGPDCWKIMGNL